MTTYPMLKICATKPTSMYSRVWLDDIEITNWLCSIKLDMGVGRITTATLELIVRSDIEIPASVMVTVIDREGGESVKNIRGYESIEEPGC